MSGRGPLFRLCIVALLTSLVGAVPAGALTVSVTAPPDGALLASNVAALNGTASGPSLATLRFDEASEFQNGTFNRSEITAAGAVGVTRPNATTIRFFDNFSYGNNADPAAADPMWVGQTLAGNASTASWRAANGTAPMAGAVALRANAPLPGSSLYWRTVAPAPITRVYIEFRYAAQANGRLEVFVSGDGVPGSDARILLVYSASVATPETNFTFDATSIVANRTSFYVRLTASSGGGVAIDDFAVEATFQGSATPASSGYNDSFSNATKSAVWWDARNVWQMNASGPSTNGRSLTHSPTSPSNGSDSTFGMRTATALQAARLTFNYTCEANGTFRAFVAPLPGQPGTMVVNASGAVGMTLYDGDITAHIGNATLLLRFQGGALDSSANACSLDDFRLTFQMAGNASGIARGDYVSRAIDMGVPVLWNTTWSYFDTPPGGGRFVELRAGSTAGTWSAWVRAVSGSVIPFSATRYIQFRVSMWGVLAAGLPNLTAFELRHYVLRAVEVSADGWASSVNATLNYSAGPLAVNWSANVTLQSGWNTVSVRAFDGAGASTETSRSYFWDTFPPSAPGTPSAGGPLSNQSVVNWSWAPATDVGFGIADYRVNVGTTPGGSDVIRNGSVGASPWFAYNGVTHGRTYYLAVQARDGAQLWSPWSNSSSGVTVDLVAPQPTTPLVGAAWVNSSSITWTWAPFPENTSGVDAYFVRVGTAPGGLNVVNGAQVTANSYTFTGAADGGTYYASVRARDGAMNYGPWSASSDAVRVDLAAPPSPAAPTGPVGYANITRATWSWNAVSDGGSGVASYEVAAGTSPQGEDLQPPTATPGGYYTLSALPDGVSVYVRVRARDLAGNSGAWSLPSVALTVDRTPPGGVSFTSSPPRWGTSTTMSWSWTDASESGSGTATYIVRLGAVPGGESIARDALVSTTSFTRTGIPEGFPAYLTVRAVDFAGNEGPRAISEAAQVDGSWPSEPSFVVEPASPSRFANLTWVWPDSTDVGSGVAGYEVQVGTSAGAADILDWNFTAEPSFTFSGGTSGARYFLSLRAVDGVGLRSGTAFAPGGVFIDLEPPEAVTATVETALTRAASVTIRWGAASDQGGSYVVGFEIEVTDGGSSQIRPVPATPTAFELVGDDGAAYTVRVRAKDTAGNEGPWSPPVAVLFDRTPPTAPASIVGATSPTSITFEWGASTDSASGVRGYYLDVGTQPGVGDIVNHAFVNATEFTVQWAPGQALYVTITAEDMAGNNASASGPASGVRVPETRVPGFEAAGVVAAIAALAIVWPRTPRRNRRS